MANTDIKWFSFDNTNAPQLSNTWGCMIDVLDACLVTGYGSQQVLSIVISNGVGIATFSGVHNIKQFQVIEFSGSNNQVINNEFKVLGLTPTTIEFLIDLPDQTITESISCKIASLGWSKAFSGSQKAVYQAKDKIANPYFLRVDNSRDSVYTDSYVKFAKVGILETCRGINDLSGNQAPFDAANPNKNWLGTGSSHNAIAGWFKWQYAVHEASASGGAFESDPPSNGNRSWVLIGNSEFFYIIPSLIITSIYALPYGFGVINTNDVALPYLIGVNKTTSAGSGFIGTTALVEPTHGVAYLYNCNGQLENTLFSKLIPGFGSIKTGISGNTIKVDPARGVILTPYYILDSSNYLTGVLPLVRCCLNDCSGMNDRSIFSDDTGVYLMRKIRTAPGGSVGAIFLQIN